MSDQKFTIEDVKDALRVGVNIGMQNLKFTEIAGIILPEFNTSQALQECQDFINEAKRKAKTND